MFKVDLATDRITNKLTALGVDSVFDFVFP